MENSQYSKPEAYLGPYQASTMELLREKSQRLDTGNYFRKKAPLWMFDSVLITPLTTTITL